MPTLEQQHGTDAEAFSSETARQAMERTYRDTQDIIMRETGDTTGESVKSLAELNRKLRKGDGAQLSLQAEVTDEDGNTKTVNIQKWDGAGEKLVLEDGTTADVEEIHADADTKSFLQAMKEAELGAYTDEAYQAFLDSDAAGHTLADGIEWVTGWRGAFGVGEMRGNITTAVRLAAQYGIDTDTAAAAYYLGVKASDTAQTESMKALQDLPKSPKQTVTGRASKIDVSAIQGETMTKAEREQFNFANKLFSMIGVELRWVASDAKSGKFVGANGSYLHGVVTLDIHAGRNFLRDVSSGILATTGHELTHFLQEYAPEQYRALKDFLLQQIAEKSRDGYETLERLIWEKRQRSSRKLSRQEALDEVVADACQTMIRDSKAIREFAEEHEAAAKGLARWLDKWFKKLREVFARSSRLSAEARFVATLEEDVRKAFGELWDEALREAVRVHDEVGDIKKPAQEGGEQFSERYEAAQENSDILTLIEKVKSGSYSKGDAVSLGTIDAKSASEIKIITGIDVTGYEVILEPRMISHILTDHGENGKTDHSMAAASDIAKMEYALQNASSIVDGGATSAYVSFINGRNRPAKTVLYEAPIGEKSYYVVEAVPDTTKNKLFIVSAFIGQQGYKKGALQFTDAKGPGATSINAAAYAPDTIIAQQNGKSNTQQQNSDRD